MATLAEITAQSSAALDNIEREVVRKLLGINGNIGSAVYTESEVRFNALTPSQIKLIRAYILIDLPPVEADIAVKLGGGSDGVSYDPFRLISDIKNDIRRMLYPTLYNDPLTVNGSLTGSDDITLIPLCHQSGTTEYL